MIVLTNSLDHGAQTQKSSRHRAKACGSDGQNARAAAVIEQGIARPHLALKPFEAEPRGGVRAGAEGHARVENEDDRLGVGRRMPGGNDPQASGNPDRLEL